MEGNYYQIVPLSDFDLGKIFGISTHARFNPPSCKVAQPNPPASNHPAQKGERTGHG